MLHKNKKSLRLSDIFPQNFKYQSASASQANPLTTSLNTTQ